MKSCLIGYTGFVGSNLDKQFKFDYKYNSKNIKDIQYKEFDLVICAGVRAQKWLANQYPEQDLKEIDSLIENLKTIKAKKFVLVSTIDIYKIPINVNENTRIETDNLHAYGKNRYYLEKWVMENFDDYLILRLPALFGQGLKKNFIYDLITIIPSIIMKEKFDDIIEKLDLNSRNLLINSYESDKNGNYNLKLDLEEDIKEKLKLILNKVNYTSKVFTDERSQFPFYYLENIYKDIKLAIDHNIKILNIAVEPISAKEIANKCFDVDFNNIISDKKPIKYDIKTLYSDKFNKKGCYIYTKEEVIRQIKEYISTL